MENQVKLRERLDSTSYLYLEHFGPGDDLLSLKLEVVEGLVESRQMKGTIRSSETGPIDTHEKVVEVVTENSSPIEIRLESKRFAITFDRYLAFCTRDETYVNPEESEDFTKKLRSYKKSKFLDFVESTTWWWDEETSLSHHAVVCLNAVVDIVCAG
ncbi:MAG: hypothetical protein JWL86_5456, partial [Rhizobium sp.]|nr:hypothetical protein [Rhizobium sp.]